MAAMTVTFTLVLGASWGPQVGNLATPVAIVLGCVHDGCADGMR